MFDPSNGQIFNNEPAKANAPPANSFVQQLHSATEQVYSNTLEATQSSIHDIHSTHAIAEENNAKVLYDALTNIAQAKSWVASAEKATNQNFYNLQASFVVPASTKLGDEEGIHVDTANTFCAALNKAAGYTATSGNLMYTLFNVLTAAMPLPPSENEPQDSPAYSDYGTVSASELTSLAEKGQSPAEVMSSQAAQEMINQAIQYGGFPYGTKSSVPSPPFSFPFSETTQNRLNALNTQLSSDQNDFNAASSNIHQCVEYLQNPDNYASLDSAKKNHSQ